MLEKVSGLKGIVYNAGYREVSRCCTAGESEESIAYRQQTMRSILALKPRAKVIRSQNKDTSASTKRTCYPQKKILKEVSFFSFIGFGASHFVYVYRLRSCEQVFGHECGDKKAYLSKTLCYKSSPKKSLSVPN